MILIKSSLYSHSILTLNLNIKLSILQIDGTQHMFILDTTSLSRCRYTEQITKTKRARKFSEEEEPVKNAVKKPVSKKSSTSTNYIAVI